jgi:uncharacterized protein
MKYLLVNMKYLKQIFSIFLIALSINSFGQKLDSDGIPVKPNPPRLVNDWSNIIPDNQEAQLEQALKELALSSKTRVVLVTVNSLGDYDKSQYAYEIGERWQVGDAKFDNGIVMLVKPKEVDGKGSTFIATGYGLEGIIPDAIAKRIVEKEMIPKFKNQDYVGGIAAGLKVVSDLALKEYPASAYAKQKSTRRRRGSRLPFMAIIFVFFIISSIFGRKRRGATNTMGGSSLPWWAAIFALNSMGRGRSYGNFSSGSGGFGGFGGGSFGGGGAGGDW